MPVRYVAEETVTIEGREVPVRYRRNPQAQRLILRVDRPGTGLVVTLPTGVSLRAARWFLADHREWAARSLGALPDPVPFADGAVIPYQDSPHRIHHAPAARGGVWRQDSGIHVTGEAAHLPRRLTDWLRAEARRELTIHARSAATKLDATVGRVSVRDTTSRWGSCTHTGNLNFSWRLIFAPDWVASYVAAHEAVHLKERSHNARFWQLVRDVAPETDAAEAWLREHGPGLHRYGQATAD